MLLKAFKGALDRLPSELQVDIVGEGTENNYLKNLARQLNIAHRVSFHGKLLDEERLKELFFKAFAYVSPGPVGLGVLHSMAYGVPVVTTTTAKHGPEFHNLRPEVNSLLFGGLEELKQILVRLVTEPALSQRLGQEAYRCYSETRTLELMVRGFVEAVEGRQR